MSCEGCGSTADRIGNIVQACKILTQLHSAVAQLYGEVLADLTDEEEKAAFQAAVLAHKEMAEKSTFVTVPDAVEASNV